MCNKLSHKIQEVHNFESLVDFLQDSLNWPIPDEGLELEEITYEWSVTDLGLDCNTRARIVSCRQLRPLNLRFDLSAMGHKLDADFRTYQQQLKKLGEWKNQQPWDIFFLEFNNDVKLDACKILLSKVLQGLVGNKASLPFRKRDKLLFICITENFQNISFTCFKGGKGLLIVDDYIPLIHFKLDA